MRLIRMPAPTEKADLAVLTVSTCVFFAGGSGLTVPTCASVSPAELASFGDLLFASKMFLFEGMSAAGFEESSIWLSEIVVLHFVEKRFVTNIQVFRSPTFVAAIAIQDRLNLLAFDKTQRSLSDF